MSDNKYFSYNLTYNEPEKVITMDVYEPQDEEKKHETVKGLTSIIIPAYLNNYPIFHQTGNCIGSIRENTNKAETPYEIILVLNGKSIIPFDDLAETYCDKVIQLDENEGYAKAVNRGIRAASGEYIAVLNNDIQVYDGWLKWMQKGLESVDLVMATPMYGKPWARAVEAQEIALESEGKKYEDIFSEFKDFSCFLTTKSVFDKVGLFDEQFFMYGECDDLLKRMDNDGLKYASTKIVPIHHIIGSTQIEDREGLMNQSKEKYKKKWGEQ